MIRTSTGAINGNPIIFCQCQSADEAREAGLPAGLNYYWEINGERILSPGVIIKKVQDAVLSGGYAPQKLTSKESVNHHYQNLVTAQREMLAENLQNLRDKHAKMGLPNEHLKNVDDMLNQIRSGDVPIPDKDGVHRPNRGQVKALIGDEGIKKFFSEAEVEELFGT